MGSVDMKCTYIAILAALTFCFRSSAEAEGWNRAVEDFPEFSMRLRSLELRDLSLRYYTQLGSSVQTQAMPAIDFFRDLGATRVLVHSLQSRNYIVKCYGLRALGDCQHPDSAELASLLIPELRKTINRLNVGGLEVQKPIEEYRRQLVSVLGKLLELDSTLVDCNSEQSVDAFAKTIEATLLTRPSGNIGGEQPAARVPGTRGTPPADAGGAPQDPAGEP